MRMRAPVIVLVVALLALAAGCGDDSDSDETRAGDSGSTTSASSTSTSEAASEPAPGGSLPSRPAELTGEVTDSEGGRFLVEEQPDAPDSGRKAWVSIEGPVLREASGGDPFGHPQVEVGGARGARIGEHARRRDPLARGVRA